MTQISTDACASISFKTFTRAVSSVPSGANLYSTNHDAEGGIQEFCTSSGYEYDNERIIIWVIATETHLCSSVPSVANLYSTNRPAKRDTGIRGKTCIPTSWRRRRHTGICTSRGYEYEDDRTIIRAIATETHPCPSVSSVANLYFLIIRRRRTMESVAKLVFLHHGAEGDILDLYKQRIRI